MYAVLDTLFDRSANFAAAALPLAIHPRFIRLGHCRYDRYCRFLQLDRQNRNIFTSQEKRSFDTKKDALVFGVHFPGLPVARQRLRTLKPGFDP